MLNSELFLDPGWAACIIATIPLRKTTWIFSISEPHDGDSCPMARVVIAI
jgi:hypothetical protein